MPVFYDIAELHHHNRVAHPASAYRRQEVIATPWIAVGFTYQACFTTTDGLVLVDSHEPRGSEEGSGRVSETMSQQAADPLPTLWAQAAAEAS